MHRRTIEVKGVAGLGNRIFTLAFALHYAQKCNRKVAVDWSDGQIGPQGVDLFGLFFLVENYELDSISTGISAKEYYREFTNKYLQRLVRAFSAGQTIWISKKINPLKHRVFLLPLGLQIPWRSNLVCLEYLPTVMLPGIVRHIQLRNDIKLLATQLIPNIKSMIGVHIRQSDKSPTKSIEELCDLLKTQQRSIFLATDNESVRDFLTSNLPDVVFVPQSLHDGKSKGGLHHRIVSPEEKLALFQNSLVDAYLLSQTAYFYGQSNSTFSLLVDAWREHENTSYWC